MEISSELVQQPVEYGRILNRPEGNPGRKFRLRRWRQYIGNSSHGGGTTTTIVDRNIHDLSFRSLKSNGTVIFKVPATDPPTPVLADQLTNEFVNIGSAYEAFMGGFDSDSKR